MTPDLSLPTGRERESSARIVNVMEKKSSERTSAVVAALAAPDPGRWLTSHETST